MNIPKETLEMRYKVFIDYCNHRDRLKLTMQKTSIALTEKQADRVLRMAKLTFQQREVTSNVAWLTRLMDNLDKYFDSIKINSWPTGDRR